MVLGQLKFWLKKLQVPTEPGLSTAQLMLTNDDLRPGKTMASSIGLPFSPVFSKALFLQYYRNSRRYSAS